MGSWALKIMPMPPRPIRSTTRYFPIFSGSPVAPPTLTVEADSRGVASQDDADVVAAALGVGGGDQRLTSALQIGAPLRRDDLEDAPLGEHVGQTVGAQKHDVAVDEVLARDLEIDVVQRPRIPREIEPRVVPRELQDRATPQEVDPAVAHARVGHLRFAGGGEHGHDRGSHARVVFAGGGLAEYGAVGELDGGPQAIAVVRDARLEPVRPRDLGIVPRPFDEGRDHVGGDLRGDLAGLVPSHAVTDDEQAVAGADRVFIEGPAFADVRLPMEGDHLVNSFSARRLAW